MVVASAAQTPLVAMQMVTTTGTYSTYSQYTGEPFDAMSADVLLPAYDRVSSPGTHTLYLINPGSDEIAVTATMGVTRRHGHHPSRLLL